MVNDVQDNDCLPLSIILPCYNPPEGWQKRLKEQYYTLLDLLNIPIELVLVVDGNSSVKTAELDQLQANIVGLKFIQYPQNRGKGYALREGVKIASGAIILYTDIDFPYTEKSILNVFDAIYTKRKDVAIGIKDEAYYNHVPKFRKAISKVLQSLTKGVLQLPISDTQCGLKAFGSQHKHLFLATQIDRYLFDLEFVRNAYRHRPSLNIQAIPVSLHPGVAFRKMNPGILWNELANFLRLWTRQKG